MRTARFSRRPQRFSRASRASRFPVALALTLAAYVAGPGWASGQSSAVPSPEEFFGFEMGADRKLAGWDKLVQYYELLGDASERLDIFDELSG